MRLLIQRVSCAKVKVGKRYVSSIKRGIVVFIGIRRDDAKGDVDYLARRLSNLRIFEDKDGKTNLSLLEIEGDVMVISQFTLYGDTRKGRRPDFGEAAPKEVARELYQEFIQALTASGLNVKSGIFGERMEVVVHNDGPFTILMDSKG